MAIDVRGAEGSNRYFGDYSTDGKVVFYRDVDGTSVDYFSYEHIGRTVNGIHVLKTKSSGGGSGTFVHLLFLRFEVTKSVDQYRIEDSLLLRKVGSMVLGDRWVGELEVVGNVLTVRTIGYSRSKDDDSGEESLDLSGI